MSGAETSPDRRQLIAVRLILVVVGLAALAGGAYIFVKNESAVAGLPAIAGVVAMIIGVGSPAKEIRKLVGLAPGVLLGWIEKGEPSSPERNENVDSGKQPETETGTDSDASNRVAATVLPQSDFEKLIANIQVADAVTQLRAIEMIEQVGKDLDAHQRDELITAARRAKAQGRDRRERRQRIKRINTVVAALEADSP